MKLFIIAAPIVLLGSFVLVRALTGRPLSRHTLNVVVALFLLVYVLATAGLGVFWVARMDLPAFDLHYTFGYCVVLLVVVHLSFQLRILGTFFRRLSPAALLTTDKSRFRWGVRLGLFSVPLMGLLVSAVWFGLERARRGSETLRAEPVRAGLGAAPSAPPDLPIAPRIWIERSGERVSAFDYLHEQSSYSKLGVIRSVALAPSRPSETKRYPGARKTGLPPPRARAGRSLWAAFERPRGVNAEARIVVDSEARELELSAVAELSHYSAGVTSDKAAGAGLLLRAAASSGALYPTDLYVVARRVKGLEPGAYYYDPHRHELAGIGDAHALSGVESALIEPEILRSAAAAFVLGTTFDRTVSKYTVRSYRYLALDAGHIASNLMLVARALDLPCRLEAAFDDGRLETALALDAEQEAVMLLAICGSNVPLERGRKLAAPRIGLLELPSRPDEQELTRLSQRLTSWRFFGPVSRRVDLSALETAGSVTPSRPDVPSDADVFETIAARRSYREFAAQRIDLRELSGIARDAARFTLPLRVARLVELFVVVRAVDGLEPGVFRYDQDRDRFEPRRSGEVSARIQSAGLSQEVLGRAAAVLVWALSERAGSIDGARDYRHAGLDAGRAGEIVYLSATARGLGACGVGAFYDDDLNELLAQGESRPSALYLQGIGRR